MVRVFVSCDSLWLEGSEWIAGMDSQSGTGLGGAGEHIDESP